MRPSSKDRNVPSGPDDAGVVDASGKAYQALAEQLSFFKVRIANREAQGISDHPLYMHKDIAAAEAKIKVADAGMPKRAAAAGRTAAGEADRLAERAFSLIDDIKSELLKHREATRVSFVKVFEMQRELHEVNAKKKLAKGEALKKEADAIARREAAAVAHRSVAEQIKGEAVRLLKDQMES